MSVMFKNGSKVPFVEERDPVFSCLHYSFSIVGILSGVKAHRVNRIVEIGKTIVFVMFLKAFLNIGNL